LGFQKVEDVSNIKTGQIKIDDWLGKAKKLREKIKRGKGKGRIVPWGLIRC
jgi:hypothetical protein